jgi:hypothetical protein
MSTLRITEDRAHPALLGALVAVWLTVAVLAGGLLIAQFALVHFDQGRLQHVLSTLLPPDPALYGGLGS